MTTAAQSPAAEPAPEEDVTTALYRAAIGPVSTSYYLPIFTRFEESGRAGISWNTAASLATFSWLVFRQLWAAALAYVGIVVAVLLLVFGIGRLVFQFSDTLMMALGLGFGLAAFVLPGLFGNVVLHMESRKRMAAAIAAHADVKDALAQLNRQASTRRRAIAIGVASAAFGALVVSAYLQFSALSNLAVMPQGALDAGHVAVGRAVDGTVTSAAAPALAASAASTAIAASAPASQPASAPTATAASAPASAAASPVIAPASAPASVPMAMATAASSATPAASAAASAAPAASAAGAIASAPVAPASAPASAPAKASKPAPGKTEAPAARTDKAAERKPAPKSASKPAAASTAKPYYVNVGLFAVPENASRAHDKLLAAQLPSVTKELKSAKGPLTRVRVGPFASQQEARTAADKIKALQLDAIVVQP